VHALICEGCKKFNDILNLFDLLGVLLSECLMDSYHVVQNGFTLSVNCCCVDLCQEQLLDKSAVQLETR
jgi:hypothetical protein